MIISKLIGAYEMAVDATAKYLIAFRFAGNSRSLTDELSNSKPGLTPRGKPMPQTKEEFEYLAEIYEAALLREREINSKLRADVNDLRNKLMRSSKHASTSTKDIGRSGTRN